MGFAFQRMHMEKILDEYMAAVNSWGFMV